MAYLILWSHIYLIHFGAWVTFCLATTVMKNGVPHIREIPKILLAAVIMAAVMSVFSSHSHTHFINQLVAP